MLHINKIIVIAIIIGILSFICFNLSYAVLSFPSCPIMLKIIFWSISALSVVLLLKLCIHSAGASSIPALIIKNIIPTLIAVLVCGWLVLVSLVYLFQYQVLYTDSQIKKDFYVRIQEQKDQFERIDLLTPDNVNLQGYLYKKQKNEKEPLAIYFGGRGEEAANIAEYASKIKAGWALAFVNYRGCGQSTGRQESELLFSDATFIYDYFSQRDDIDNNNIVLISHSLGTGVAVHLAAQRKIKGVILSCPYDKYVTGVIQDRLPLIPVKLLIKEEYDSVSIAPELKIPALFILAESDSTVLRNRSMRLFDNWGSDSKKISIIKDTDHEDITLNDLTWENINIFLLDILNKGL